MENIETPSSAPTFPYLRLFAIVVMSAVLVAGIFWAWHSIQMHRLKVAHKEDVAIVQHQIDLLNTHMNSMSTVVSPK